MATYSITVSRFGHRNLCRHEGRNGGERIAGPKAWGGGTTVETFRSRSDKAATKRFEAGAEKHRKKEDRRRARRSPEQKLSEALGFMS